MVLLPQTVHSATSLSLLCNFINSSLFREAVWLCWLGSFWHFGCWRTTLIFQLSLFFLLFVVFFGLLSYMLLLHGVGWGFLLDSTPRCPWFKNLQDIKTNKWQLSFWENSRIFYPLIVMSWSSLQLQSYTLIPGHKALLIPVGLCVDWA